MIHELHNNPELAGQVRLIENITYAAVAGRPLKMQILAPWTQRYPQQYHTDPRPLIVFVQGSSWRTGRMGEEIPQLVQFVKHGYVVATVQQRHRRFCLPSISEGRQDGSSFPPAQGGQVCD